MANDQQIARVDRTPPVITTRDEYRDALKRWEGTYNVLTAFTDISGLAPQHGIVVSTIRINADTRPNGPGEVYGGLPFLKGEKGKASEEVALAKIGLRKIAECGGISWKTSRTDPRTIAHYWEVKAVASYRGIDGATVTREATVEWDLRDGSDRLKGWTRPQVEEGRKNGLRNCEARAINAAIRECGCGIKQKYTRAELERPFLVVRVAFQADMNDPDQKRMVVERGLGSTAAMYPPRGIEAGSGEVLDVQASPLDDEPKRVGSGTSRDDKPAKPATPDGYGVLQAFDTKQIERRGGVGTRAIVVDANGVQHSTSDEEFVPILRRVWDAKTPVRIESELDERFGERDITKIDVADGGLPDPKEL